MDMNTILLAACAVLLVLVVISLIMNMVNSSKINTLLDFSEDGDLVASLQHYYEKVDDLSFKKRARRAFRQNNNMRKQLQTVIFKNGYR